MALGVQVPGHLAHAEERRLQELPVDPAPQAEVQPGLAFGLVAGMSDLML
jgi:hypothetical protein